MNSDHKCHVPADEAQLGRAADAAPPRMSERRTSRLTLLFLPIMAAYPLFVLIGLRTVGTRMLGVLIVLFAVARYYSMRRVLNAGRVQQWGMTALTVILGLAAISTGQDEALLFLPAFVSAAMAFVFLHSASGTRVSVIERIAKWHRGCTELPPTASVYCRRISIAWGLFMVLNAAVIAGLAAWAPVEWWSLYSGLISYLLMGLLFGLEYVYRRVRVQPIADREARELERN